MANITVDVVILISVFPARITATKWSLRKVPNIREDYCKLLVFPPGNGRNQASGMITLKKWIPTRNMWG